MRGDEAAMGDERDGKAEDGCTDRDFHKFAFCGDG
jgi:hypothetical protein